MPNTRDKRASALGVNSSAPRLEQNPAGLIAQSGRQIAGLVYSGILAIKRQVVGSDNTGLAIDLPELGLCAPGSLILGDGGGGGLT